jgi:transposase
MEQYVGLDVSQKETAICVIDSAGARLWEGTCRSTPEVIAGVLKHGRPRRLASAWRPDRWPCGTGTR